MGVLFWSLVQMFVMKDQKQSSVEQTCDGQAGQFSIEVADGQKCRAFSARPLGHDRYELVEDHCIVGTIQLDGISHGQAERRRGELDLPLLHDIREQLSQQIQLRELRAKFLELYGCS